MTLAERPRQRVFAHLSWFVGGTLESDWTNAGGTGRPNGGQNGLNGAVGSDGASGPLPGDPGRNGTARWERGKWQKR